MHELSVGKSILKIVLEKSQGKKIKKVRVCIGQAHYLEESSLSIAWRNLTLGTIAEKAELDIERPPLRFCCHQCEKEFIGEAGVEWRCPDCDSTNLDLVGGREMEVISLIEEEPDGD